AYVFGSQVEGRADAWSDIDVAVFLDGAESWDMQRRAQTMFQVQKGAGLDVEAHLFPSSMLVHPEPASFAAYVIKHGVPLSLEHDAA
ncbi:MAG TPA: nucleotidyltransferase domain-containing protein, partial [Candidatus Hydrogenedentes bacterium]|nr:nucleotidyltransferase domain-containing protein [Candidatus Hydrogenedentota bacterium]